MANYANQLTIKLDVEPTIYGGNGNNGEMYAPWIFWKYKKAAMKKLTGNGYKLWEYMYSWKGNGKFDLSPKRITEEIGISDKGIRIARKELEDHGCLKLEEGKTNVYIFTPAAIL
jgi:hypothetical protein